MDTEFFNNLRQYGREYSFRITRFPEDVDKGAPEEMVTKVGSALN